MPEPIVNEGEPVVGADGKHPETVTWGQYVGVKESLGKKLDTATTKLTSLEEQLKKAISAEEFTKTKTELDSIKAEHAKVLGELKATKDQTLAERRTSLVKRGIPEADLKDLSDKELVVIEKALGSVKKPLPDMGGGGGSVSVASSKDRIKSGFEALHPSK